MKKYITYGVIIILFFNIFPITSSYSYSNNIIYVDDDGGADYTKIQDAIDNASDGYTIYVYNGTYFENIIIDKTIELIGENKENTYIIDNFSHSSSAITIEKNNVTISYFTIIGEAVSNGIYIHSDQTRIIDNIILSAGILVNSGNNTVTNNYIDSGGSWGIGFYPDYSSFNEIVNNTIITNGVGMYLLGSCKNNSILHNTINAGTSGIRLLESNKNIIKDNIMSEGGFHLQNSYDNIIINNSVNEKPICYLYNESDMPLNKDYGQIIIINCENITIEHQYIFDLRTGIHLYRSKNCKIINNTITHNHPFRGHGIDILYCENTIIMNNNLTYLDAIDVDYSDYTIVSYNTIVNCRTGISLKYCNNTVILKNNIVNNSLCIDFYFGSMNSIVTLNNLIGRPPTASFCDPINANNIWHNNYWGRPKILPKIIFGQLIIKDDYFPSLRPWLKFDWHPAKEPYDINVEKNPTPKCNSEWFFFCNINTSGFVENAYDFLQGKMVRVIYYGSSQGDFGNAVVNKIIKRFNPNHVYSVFVYGFKGEKSWTRSIKENNIWVDGFAYAVCIKY